MSEVRRAITLGAMAAAMAAFGPAAVSLIADAPAPAALAASTPSEPGAGDFGNFLAGMHAKSARDFGSMSDYLSRVLAHDPDNVDLLQQGFIAMASGGRLTEAAEIGRKLDAQSAGSDTVSLVLAMQDLKADKRAEALTRLGALSSTTGLNKFTMPLVKSWVALEDGKRDDALAALAPLADVKGVQTLYDLHAGLLNELSGHPAEADAAYKKALDDPDKLSFRVVEIIGNFYQRQKRFDDAKAVYAKFAETYPDNPLLPLLIEKQADANVAPVVGSARDGLAEALFNLGSVLFQEDARDMALVYTRLALDLRKDYPAAQVLLGDLLAGEKLYAEAVAAYKAVDAKSPFGWQARLALADALNRTDRTQEAVTLLEGMAAERKESADASMMLGDILRSSERFEEAAKAYDDAIARIGPLTKEQWSLLYYRGIAYERSNQWDKAEADFLKALEFEPDQPYVLNYLAYTWVDKGKNYDRALTMLNKAVEEKPEDGYIVDSLGWVYFRLGKYDQAVEQLERAVELVPGDSVINDHLGDAYWRVGRHTEARFQWHRALNLNPEKDQVAPIESKVEKGLPPGSTSSGS
jgi:tetratricopeptide (TPR) repeat protein